MRKINLRFDRRQFAKSVITAVMGDEKSTVVSRRVVSRRFTQSFPQIYAERRVHKFIALKKQEYSTFCVNLRENNLRETNTLRDYTRDNRIIFLENTLLSCVTVTV